MELDVTRSKDWQWSAFVCWIRMSLIYAEGYAIGRIVWNGLFVHVSTCCTCHGELWTSLQLNLVQAVSTDGAAGSKSFERQSSWTSIL